MLASPQSTGTAQLLSSVLNSLAIYNIIQIYMAPSLKPLSHDRMNTFSYKVQNTQDGNFLLNIPSLFMLLLHRQWALSKVSEIGSFLLQLSSLSEEKLS